MRVGVVRFRDFDGEPVKLAPSVPYYTCLVFNLLQRRVLAEGKDGSIVTSTEESTGRNLAAHGVHKLRDNGPYVRNRRDFR
jgi:hypothetical protein